MEDGNGNMPQVPSTEIESLTYTGGGSFNNNSGTNSGGNSGGGGGGGSKSKKAEKGKKSEVVERYKQIEDKLDDIRDA
jgi:hypothetical protein